MLREEKLTYPTKPVLKTERLKRMHLRSFNSASLSTKMSQNFRSSLPTRILMVTFTACDIKSLGHAQRHMVSMHLLLT